MMIKHPERLYFDVGAQGNPKSTKKSMKRQIKIATPNYYAHTNNSSSSIPRRSLYAVPVELICL